jgi:hypothetical protein
MFCFISPGAQGTPGSPGHPGVPGAAGNISDSNCSSTFTLNKVMLSRCRLSSRLQQYCGSQSKTRTAIRNWQLNIQTIDRHLKTLTLELGIGRRRWNLECRHNSTCLTINATPVYKLQCMSYYASLHSELRVVMSVTTAAWKRCSVRV